jgi:hypothetical protein
MMTTIRITALLASEGDLGGALQGFSPVAKSAGMVMQDVFKVIGVLLLLTFFLGLVIYITRSARKSSNRRHHSHHHRHRSKASTKDTPAPVALEPDPAAPSQEDILEAEEDGAEPEEATHRPRHRRQRRRRREHRHRNPTLSETGGLPPLRDPNSPPPPLL